MYDIVLEHFSRGNPNAEYYRSLISVFKKWKDMLPLYAEGVSPQIIKNIGWIEYRGLTRLLCKMVRRKMPANEIKAEISYFTDNLQLRFAKWRKLLILPQIYLMRAVHYPLYVSKKEKQRLGRK